RPGRQPDRGVRLHAGPTRPADLANSNVPMSDETGDTEVAGDTVAASEAGASARPAPKIRPSRPSLHGGDYAELVVVDREHYVIQREIARGGMGRIHVARDRRLGREVAIKEVLSDKGGLARRFERE